MIAARETPITALTITRDVPARMRDGVVLRANVYRPAAPGPWPTLLTRTPYGKDLPGASAWLDPVRAAAAGFMVVVQDVRGRFASDGGWEPFLHESSDGFDTVEWAARLPGSNGRVGMFGLSYWGNTQWLAAISQPPSLRAIAPALTWSDPDDGLLHRGGAREFVSGLVWGLEQGIDFLRRGGDAPERVESRVQSLLDTLDGLAQRDLWQLPASTAAVLARHGVPGLGFAREGAAGASACRVAGRQHRVHVPVLGIGGWHDAFIQGVLDNHAAMTTLGRDSRIVIGPWSHANFSDTIGELPFGTRARRDGGPAGGPDDLTAMQLEWFAGHLAPDAGRGFERPPVRVFVMGANRWREERSWPPPGATEQRWYLRAGGGLSADPPDAREPVSEFVYDPADPVPSGSVGAPTATPEPLGPADQAAVEARPDVLVFTSAPLTADLEVAGPVRVVLHARSSAPSTDWVARLCDVHPNGISYTLCDGILRVGDDAGEPRHHQIDLWSTCNLFRRGHRLRVHVTSSSFPRWDRNLNTGRQDEARHFAARQRIDHDAQRPSWLALTVVRRCRPGP
ncbi:MAG TPA: CocE/NonD family hydrolase [Solirubrobacteraceae bacterium]|nr:CocE/NonD family hydrolase [Solirubrobacteraceae bacterium]